jgi:serine/threonine protein kinase
MLTRDPQQRPTAAELLQHPWLVSATACRSCWSTSSASASDCRTCAGEAMESSSSNSSSSSGRQQQQQQQQQQQVAGAANSQQQQPAASGGAPLPLYLKPIEDSLVQR